MFRLTLIGFIALSITSTLIYFMVTKSLGLNDVKIAAIEKMTTSIISDLERAMPLIEEAGYQISSVEAELSIPPEVTTAFELEKVVPHEKQKKLLKALDGNAIGKLVLGSLMQAFTLEKSISIKDMKMKTIEITISLPPFVTIEYEK